MSSFAVRVPEDYVWLMGRYVAEGQAIVPGYPLMDVMTPEGVVQTIKSECWGVVAHIEGHRVFRNDNFSDMVEQEYRDEFNDIMEVEEDEDDDGESAQGRSSSGGMGVIFSKGDVICHIVGRTDRGSKKAGLHPRPSQQLRWLRGNGLIP